MLIVKLLMNLLQALNEKTDPRAIAGGVAMGAVVGLTPKGSPHNLAIVFLLFILNVNGSAAAFTTLLFALFSYLVDPLFNRIGYGLLTAGPLQGFWTAIYNTPGAAWTRFNNTLVLGSLVFSLLLFWPLFWWVTWAVPRYRDRVLAHAERWKIFQLIKASKVYELYKKYA